MRQIHADHSDSAAYICRECGARVYLAQGAARRLAVDTPGRDDGGGEPR